MFLMQIKDCWLGYQGLVSPNTQMREVKTTRKEVYICLCSNCCSRMFKSLGCLWLVLELR